MKKIAANYVHTHPVFVIQNLETPAEETPYSKVIATIKNLLTHQFPASLSRYLREEIGDLHRLADFAPSDAAMPMMLADAELATWHKRIKGDDRTQTYPAKKLMEEVLPQFLGEEWLFVQSMFLPNMSVNEIAQSDNIVFREQYVDFYLPQAQLVVELDGQFHKNHDRKRLKDNIRDEYLKKYGIETVHLHAQDLDAANKPPKRLQQGINAILEQLRKQEERLSPYQKTYFKLLSGFSEEELENKLLPTAIMRFQWLVLELLSVGKLSLTQPNWTFLILERDVTGFVPVSVEDIYLTINKLCEMHDLPCQKPELKLLNLEDELTEETIVIDFSLFKRWTDEAEQYPQCIFVRNDYYEALPKETDPPSKTEWMQMRLNGEFARYATGCPDALEQFDKLVQNVIELKGSEQKEILEDWLSKASRARMNNEQKAKISNIILRYYPEETTYLARQLDAPFLLTDTVKSKIKQLQNLNNRLYEQLKAIR